METNNNPTPKPGPVHRQISKFGSDPPSMPEGKSPVLTKEGRKWLIKYQTGNHNLVLDNTEMNNVVYLFKCTDTTVVIKGKINSIIVDSCEKTSVAFDTIVSAVEFINCQSVQMQVFGYVPTICVDKTDGCQMYLNPESLCVEVISCKSSGMNILMPNSDGEYVEYPVPDQYKTTITPSGLNTEAVNHK